MNVVAQTYPGGVSPSNMTVWLRAETGWTPSSWTNQAPATPTGSSAFTNIGLYVPSGSQPILNPLLANFNFNPAVQLVNNGYQLDGNGLTSFYSSATSNSAQITYFGVSDVVGFDLISNIYSNMTFAPCGSNRCNSGFRYNNTQFGNTSVSAIYPTTEINNIGMGRRVSDTNRSSFVNGSETNITGSASLPNSGTYSFAVGTWGFGTYYVNSKSIPEIIWYKTALNDSDVNKVNSYLALKYGVTLSTSATAAQNYTASDGTIFWNATTATSAYRYNIFGLGRDDNSAGIHQRISHSVNNSGTTTTAGQYLTVSTNNNFTSQNTSVNHPDIPNDLQFIMYADNGGDYTDYSTPFSSPSITGIGKRSSRIWQAQDTKGFGVLHYQFNSIPGGHSNYYIAKSDDPSFTSNVTVTPITVTGDTAEIQMDLNNQGTNNGVTYFTLIVTDMPPCSGIDSDGDGIADSCDLDDDNDGILDVNECPLSADLITNGTFINSNAWSANNWVVGSSYTYAYITSDGNTPNTDLLTQTVNGLIPGPVTLSFSTLFFNAGNQEKLDVYLGNIKYASLVSSAGNGNVTVTAENGATVNMTSFPESSSWSDSNWKNIQITFPYTSAGSAQVLKFDAYTTGSGSGDDIGIDDVSLNIQGCDTDGDGIPNALDLDSDGDGCYDAIEGDDKVSASQVDGNGRITGSVDLQGVPVLVNPGGLADSNGNQGQDVGAAIDSTLNYCTDTDGDGVPDIDDLDDDNDGIMDCIENGFDGNPTSAFRLASKAYVVNNPSSGPTYQFRLTDGATQQGQAWSYGKVDFTKSFSITMKVLLSAADGMAIVFQNSPLGTAATGTNGQGLGARGISNGIALELDTYANSCNNDVNNAQNCDPNYDHGSIRTTADWIGAGKLAGDGQLGDGTVDDGAWHEVVVKWNASSRNLSYTFDGATVTGYNFSASGSNALETILGGSNQAYFGFTGSTGATGSINAVGFDNPCTIPLFFDTDGDGIKDYLDLDSDNDGCPDAIEGGDKVVNNQLNPNTSIAGPVDANGVPVLVNPGGAADMDNAQGQSIGNSQDATVNDCPDNDQDGIPDWQDLDDDNDGIPDTVECPSLTERIANGSFTNNTNNWTLGSGWIYDANDSNRSLENSTDGSTGTVSQNLASNGINLGLTSGKSYNLTFKLGVKDHINAGGNTSSLLVKLGGVTYATINNADSRSNGNITITLANGATSTFVPFGTVNQTGYAYRAITITIPYTGTDQSLSFSMNGGNDDWKLDHISLKDATICDTDGDNIPDHLDLDSDGDGCFDALEGDENVTASQLNTDGSIDYSGNGGIGVAPDTVGIPNLVNNGGTADAGGDAGQGIGDSQNSSVNACGSTYCYKPGAIETPEKPALISKVGITSLDRSQAQADNWPAVRNGAWLVLEAKTKGFVPNRIAFDGTGNPVGINPAHFTEGMMVYDTTNKCLKMYTTKDGSSFGWYCITTQTCPD